MPGSAINIKANAQEVINLKRKIDELSSALVSMQRSANPALYDKLNSQLQKTTIQYNALRSEVNRYSKEQERAAKATTQTSDSLVDLIKKGAAIGGITFGVDKIIQLGSEIISVRGEIQQLQIAFETMLGSKEKADRMMADIKKLALSTPFTLTEVADNTKQIIAMGIASDKAIDTVKMLGDVAAGVSVPLWRVAINYGQVSALGKLQSREIRDFAMAGIPIVDELGKMLGKTSAEIYDMVEAGKIGFPQVEQAFKNMSGEGGKFYNLMEKQNASVTGQISKLKDSIQLMFNEIGESSEGIIYTAIDGASKLVDSYQEVGVILAGLVSTYGLYKAALMTEAAIRPIQIADTYKVQAAALTELLNGEQAYRISQMGLVQGSAEHVAAIQAEIAATAENLKIKLAEEEVNLQSLRTKRAEAEQVWMTAKAKTEAARQELASAITNATGEAEASLQKKMALESEKQSRAALRLVKLQDQKDTAISQAIALKEKEASAEKIAAKNREIASIQAKIASARAEEIQHGRNVAAMRAEIKSGVDITANKNVQTLTNKLNTLSEQENSAATAHSGVVKQIVGSKVLIKKLSVDADTASTILNTEAEIANTTATTFLSAAKTKLITISKNLWAALAPNPYILAATAVVALSYGIYELATAATAAEQAQIGLNKETENTAQKTEEEKRAIENLLGIIRDEVSTRTEKQKALETLQSKYPSIFSNLDTEKIKNLDLAEAIRQVNIELEKRNGAQSKANIDRAKQILSGITNFDGVTFKTSKDIKDAKDLIGLEGVWQRNSITNAKLKESLEKYVAQAEKDLNKMSETADKAAKKTAKSGVDQIYDATKRVSDLNNELKDLNNKIIPDNQKDNPSFKFSKAIEDKLKELKDAENELNLLLYGKSTKEIGKENKAGESAADKARESSLKLLNLQSELDSESVKQQLEYEQKLLDIEQDSFDKRYRQNQLNMAKELISIEEFRQKMIKDQQEAAKNIYIKNKGSDTGFNFATFDKTLLPQGLSDADIEAQIKKRTDASLAAWKKGNEDIAKEQRSFADEEKLTFASQLDQQIYSIRKHYKERRDLANGNSDLIKQIEKNESREITEARLQAHQRQLESDAEYNQKYKELTTDRYFFESDKRKASLGQQIKDQKKIFNDLEKRVMNDPNNDELARQLREAFLNLKILNKELEKTKKLSLGEFVNVFDDLSTSISSLSGFDISVLTNTFSGLGNIYVKIDNLLKSLKEVDPSDYMKTLISGGIGIAGMATNVASGIIGSILSQKERQAEIQREINKLQQQYNIDLRQQNYDLISSIDYARAFKDNLEALQWLIDKGFISDVDYSAWEALVKQSDEARKNFEIAKKNSDSILSDTNKTLDSLYKDFVKGSAGDAIGNQAKPIISILKDWKNGIIDNEEAFRRLGATGWKGMSDIADKIARSDEETQKWTDQIAELSQQMDEFATGTSFDSFLSDAANAISDLRGNVTSLADFTEEKLTNAILSSFKYQILSNALKPMYDDLADMFRYGNIDASAANDWKQRLTDILNTNSKELDKIFSAFGIDPKEVGSSSQTPSSGYSVSMSQDTGDKLVGIQTGSQMRLISLDQNVARIAQWNQPVSEKFNFDTIAMPLGALSQSSIRIERMMEENRNIAINSYYELKDINKNTKELYAIRDGIEGIKRNTDEM